MAEANSRSASIEIPDEESIRGAALLSDVILRSLSQSEYSSDAFTTDDECQQAMSQVAKDLKKGFFQPTIALRGLRVLACQLRKSANFDPELRKGIDKHITYVLQHGLIQNGATAHAGDTALTKCMELIASLCEEFIEIEFITSRALYIALKMAVYLPELSETSQRDHIYQGTITICQRTPKVALKLLERVTRMFTRLFQGPTGAVQDKDYSRALFLSHVIQLLVDAAPVASCNQVYKRLIDEVSMTLERLSLSDVVLCDASHSIIEALQYKLTKRTMRPSQQTDIMQTCSQSQSQSMSSSINQPFVTPESSEFSLSENDAGGVLLSDWFFNWRASQ